MSLTVKNDDVTSHRRDVDPHGRLRAAQGRIGIHYYFDFLLMY